MGLRKPILGYPSMSAAVVALRSEGKGRHQVAGLLGISIGAVSALEHSANRAKKVRLKVVEDNMTVLIPKDVLRRGAVHAARRGIKVNELVRRIVETVLEDDMVDAVLDDDAAKAGGRAP